MSGGTLAAIHFKFLRSLTRIPLVTPSTSLTLRRPRSSLSTSATSFSTMASESYKFGPYKIDPTEVFYSTKLSYAMVNLRPVVPGHILLSELQDHSLGDVLVCPKREVKRFGDLTSEETADLWLSAQKIGKELEQYHNASSLTFTIQDGPQAGQTVPHVHIHVLPRKVNDFANNDEIYDAIDSKEKELTQKLDLDKERVDRSIEEMAEEAASYRKLF